MSWVTNLIVQCPWIPVLILVPLCVIYDTYCYLRIRANAFIRARSGLSQRKHEDKVRKMHFDMNYLIV
jgi:hypothetical protein